MKKIVYLVIFLITLIGCATVQPFYVKVDSINNGTNGNNWISIVLPGKKEINANDLQFQEFAKYIKKAFESKGFNVVDDASKADVVVFMNYGISDPDEH